MTDSEDFVLYQNSYDGQQLDLEERSALRRVAGISTELEDITEVEYRQLRLERVVLIGVWNEGTLKEATDSLKELAALAETAGAQVLDGLLQRRENPDPATYVGKGKAQELKDVVREVGADTVIANSELAPSQRRSLEDVVKVKVIDRTAIILDIFAQHAKSREGKAQVELAQLEYLLPRLRGWGDSMSRQAGGQAAGGVGIGSRGPGETKIELDRRRINSRMARLRKQITAMAPARAAMRKTRQRNKVPMVAIAGYTNAGKSSILNRITRAGVLVENALFATLDPTVRKHQTEDGREYTLADTVGFVENLPHQLVEAFRSTLEEIAEADLIVIAVDGSNPQPMKQLNTVRSVMAETGISGIEQLVVFNKRDLIPFDVEVELANQVEGCMFVSAKTGAGIDQLEERIANLLPRPEVEFKGLIPYHRGDLISRIHLAGELLESEYQEHGTKIHALVEHALASELEQARI
ncbi:MAG: GTPase HflX [Microbacteriaceae bacterium]|nr:GTPase HflX [Microbacteriaceae bacterium]MDR9443727.1 GTPase HflX [Microbacteriaceae bacterium]